LTKTAVGSIFKTQGSWEGVFGEARFLLDPESLEPGLIRIPLEISQRAEVALKK